MSAIQKKMGVALVGLGSYSTTQLTEALNESQHCYLAGVVTGTPVKASMWKRKFNLTQSNIYNYSNFDDISANTEIEAVYVALPNSMHKEFVIRAAQAGKHVICEKPLGLNHNDCLEMINACKQMNVELVVGYRLCYDFYWNRIKRLVTQNGISGIQGALSFHLNDNRNWRLQKSEAGGGALIDIGIYGVYTFCYLLNSVPDSVEAEIVATDFGEFSEVEESISFSLHFGQTRCSFSASYTDTKNWLRVFFKNGESTELLNAFAPAGLIMTGVGGVGLESENQVSAQLDDFAEAIRTNNTPMVTGLLALRDAVIMEAIYKAAESGKIEEVNYTTYDRVK